MNLLLLHCRPGFEKECAQEIQAMAAQCGDYGYCKTESGCAYVMYHSPQGKADRIMEKTAFRELVFARQWSAASQLLEVSAEDRITPIMEMIHSLPFAAQWVLESSDTNEGKSLSRLLKSLQKPLSKLIEKRGLLRKRSPWRLHVSFLTGTQVIVGLSRIDNSSPWVMGIPRLKVPREAPSRATLKLEEAWHTFIPEQQWGDRIAGGMRAVDLGAAPGGWTWQLVNRGMFVTAVDNGPMAESLMQSGLVTHERVDGFVYEPKRSVRWMVCDIADKPRRTASMIAKWMTERWCTECVFNLKLPMQNRYQELQQCRQLIESECEERGVGHELHFKQLYHDREEVTGHIRRLD
ncbi:23S rRNA (cytidine(2498)-2'-O)-methyltransferase RlmM [Marinibactrum halimedae]|uniref:Ribosomal RNA large subunit methyltransferase M n=1 Tax=Marinibactrum halimedae TaxID=1444977 RepID=A0AA37T3T0_9GAMM|nr:23S rRNA (cytidine(2498)-2'-O)-methyltransferase RlmM [Marinibactrum halimedae]MCD9457846.1 23S rRNA (cytidine(2498)-2'-O)-methyltransferase RlmM [Marinibactrum halimedae]GLS26333.1 ribosomal RNA large subunit methyltransferase M [Marinibactrum halimedae]